MLTETTQEIIEDLGISLIKNNTDKIRDFTTEWIRLKDIKRILENHRKCSSPISESCYNKILNELGGKTNG